MFIITMNISPGRQELWQKQIPWEGRRDQCDELDNRRESSVDNDKREDPER